MRDLRRCYTRNCVSHHSLVNSYPHPDQLRTIKAATKVIQEEASFDGLLPAGSYTLAGQPFTVHAELSLKERNR